MRARRAEARTEARTEGRRAVKILYGILAVLALLVAALFLVPPFLDWERLKPEIAERVEAATGRRLWIDGEISVSLLPAPTLTLANLRLANLPGARAPDMARIESIDLALALGPLLGGEIAVTSLALTAPVVELERLADGRPNWLVEGAADAASGRAVRLDSIAVTDGTVVYRDGARGTPARIERIDALFSARSLDGPFRGEGAFSVAGAAVDFRLATGARGVDGAMPATGMTFVDWTACRRGICARLPPLLNSENPFNTPKSSEPLPTGTMMCCGISPRD